VNDDSPSEPTVVGVAEYFCSCDMCGLNILDAGGTVGASTPGNCVEFGFSGIALCVRSWNNHDQLLICTSNLELNPSRLVITLQEIHYKSKKKTVPSRKNNTKSSRNFDQNGSIKRVIKG
jgi:hypothetical protein